MAARRGARARDKFSEDERQLLDELDSNPSKNLNKFGCYKSYSLPNPQLCFLLPKNSQDVRIYRRSPVDLPALLHQDRRKLNQSVWFWIAQLTHYGIYDPSIKHDVKWRMARRCRRVLRQHLKRGNLKVPETLILHEERLKAERTRKIIEEQSERLVQASAENGTENSAATTDLTDNVPPIRSDDDRISHTSNDISTTACSPPAPTQDLGDDGYSSSVDHHFVVLDAQFESADEIDSDEESQAEETEDEKSMLDSMPDSQAMRYYSFEEIQVLHKWRDRFCTQHNMTRAEFQVMMTRSHGRGNTEWTCDFITKDNFLERYREQLPSRDRPSLLRFRARHNWDPPKKGELVKTSRAPTSLRKHRRSRLSLTDSDDEEIDDGEVEILNARAAVRDTDIWELKATESLFDVDMTDGAPNDSEEDESADESSDEYQTYRVNRLPIRSTEPSETREGPQRGPGLGGRTTTSSEQMTPILHRAKNAAKLHTQGKALHERTNDTRYSTSAVRQNSTSAGNLDEDCRITGSAVQNISRSIEIEKIEEYSLQNLPTLAPSHMNEFEDTDSIPSSPPQSKLLKTMPEEYLAGPPIEAPQTPTRSILRTNVSPSRPRLPKPRIEEFMNTYHDLPAVLLKAAGQTDPLQAVKRIAGNYCTLFTQLSRIEQEEQLDNFVAYVSKYKGKPSGQKSPKDFKNRETGVVTVMTQNTKKRRRSLEDDGKEVFKNEGTPTSFRSEVKDQEESSSVETNFGKTKRPKGTSTAFVQQSDASIYGIGVSAASAGAAGASSRQTPRSMLVHGITRSASYPDTPVTSNTMLSPITNLDYLHVQTNQARREPSFEFPTPAFAKSNHPAQPTVSSVSTSMKRLSPFTDGSTTDRNKPYGSLENPHIIPSTPRTVRTVRLEVEDESPGSLPILRVNPVEQVGSKTDELRKNQPTLSRAVTPGTARSSDTFPKPTPPSVVNRGVSQLSNVRLGQSFSQSPTFAEAMRHDARLFRKNRAVPVRNPTRNPIVQAQLAGMQLDSHNLGSLNVMDNEEQANISSNRPENGLLSRPPQKYISPFLPNQVVGDERDQTAHRVSSGGGALQKDQNGTSATSSTKQGSNLAPHTPRKNSMSYRPRSKLCRVRR